MKRLKFANKGFDLAEFRFSRGSHGTHCSAKSRDWCTSILLQTIRILLHFLHMRTQSTECPVTFGTLSKHYFSAPNKDIKIPKDIVCRGSFAILSNVLQAK